MLSQETPERAQVEISLRVTSAYFKGGNGRQLHCMKSKKCMLPSVLPKEPLQSCLKRREENSLNPAP